jgi:hypothetical protein
MPVLVPFLIQALVSIAISIALKIVMGMLTPSSSPSASKSKETDSARGLQANTTDSQRTLPLIYGTSRVGINRVYMGTTGANNKVLHIIGTLCEGPIKGIRQVDGIDQIFLGEKLYTEYNESKVLVSYEFFDGAANQAVCATLHAAIPEWNDPLHYTAYIYITLTYDGDYFNSLPEITVELEGMEVYNPATATTAYSNDPALCARDFIIRSSKRGGMQIAAARINDDSIADSKSYCTTKGWECDIALTDQQPCIDNFKSILDTF